MNCNEHKEGEATSCPIIESLLEWIEQEGNSTEKPTSNKIEENSLETRLPTARDVARILNISKGAPYRLIQLGQIPSVRINSSVRVRPGDLEECIFKNLR